MVAKPARATYADLEALPANRVGEILFGVRHAWLIDPSIETLEVFRLDGDTWRMLKTWRGRTVVRAEPFDAIELDLAVLWDR